MSIESQLVRIESTLARIERKLSLLSKEAKTKKVWLSPQEVIELTGWDKDALRRKRANALIEYKGVGKNGYLYALDSIPAVFIKQKVKEIY